MHNLLGLSQQLAVHDVNCTLHRSEMNCEIGVLTTLFVSLVFFFAIIDSTSRVF